MKVSLKIREERKPLVRARLPLNVLGLPLFTGVASGDQEDLALHVGTDFGIGPSVRMSYKPNQVASPFAVVMKTGFGVWGSPDNAAVALSATLNLDSHGSPLFSVRVKPTWGDFGVRKHSGCFRISELQTLDRTSNDDSMSASDIKPVMSDTRANVKSPVQPGRQSSPAANGDHHIKSSVSLGTGAGPFVMEKVGSFSNSTLEKSGGASKMKSESDSYDDLQSEHVGDSEDDGVLVDVARKFGRKSWLRDGAKGWMLNAHSYLPLGGWAVGKVRWQMQFASNLFHDARHGFRISDIKLPSLTADKVSLEIVNSRMKSKSDLGGFGHDWSESSQLGTIASMCGSMRNQLQLLHLENKILKTTIDDWRKDMGIKRSGGKSTDLMMQEETALRSQLFDELNGKLNGKLNGLGGKSGAGNGGEDFSSSEETERGLQKAIKNATGGDAHSR